MEETLGFALRQTKEMKAEVNEKEEMKKMKRNKIGTMFMVSVLALAGIGISYAGFTDEIFVYGTVNTATVDLDVVGYSCTFVWKIWDFGPDFYYDPYPGLTVDVQNEIAIYHGPCVDNATIEAGFVGCQIELQSFAKAMPGDNDEEVKMEFDNLFPCIDFIADFIIHYNGSIPVRVNLAEWLSYDGWLAELDAAGGVEVVAYRWDMEEDDFLFDDAGNKILVDIGYQLHYCNYVIVCLIIHLPQDNYWQGLTGSFEANIGVIQWNDDCDIVFIS